jgi:hypothetical protein
VAATKPLAAPSCCAPTVDRSITLDREVAHLKDELMPKYASLIYTGYWWSPERLMLQQMIDASQVNVNGVVRLKLYKGNVVVTGRKSDDSLFDANIARRRWRRLQPGGRCWLHQAQRAAHAHCCQQGPEAFLRPLSG